MKRTILSLFAVGLLAACGNGTGPGTQISLSFSGGASVSSPNPGLFSAADPLTDGTNTLTINSAEVVLRRIKLKRQEVLSCDATPEPPGCEDFVVGPQLISLPTDGTTSEEFTISGVDEGVYTEVEFEIHKVTADDPFPNHVDLSIRVEGTFSSNGSPAVNFTYETDLNEKQEIVLTTALTIGAGGTGNVTIVLDLDTWFRDGPGGNLIDPDTANKGGINENLVKDNIRASIDAF